ncbi:MAG: hypothetical protein H7Y86_19090 [Rhizobacter sp.]|nr:hypothetical protein [Ferruginibacter sp.]
MKTLYTIYFFLSIILLIGLSAILLRTIDKGAGAISMLFVSIGIIASIVLLVVLLLRYLKIPPAYRDS